MSLATKQVMMVDENDNDLEVVSRERTHKEGLLHRIAVVYLVRDNGDVLVQERMSGRLDHSAAGHVDLGEDYFTAAKRELKEELGVDCELVELGKIMSDEVEPEAGENRIRHFSMVYVANCEPGELVKDEVKSVFLANPQEVFEQMKNDVGNYKFCGGFKASLKFYLDKKLV